MTECPTKGRHDVTAQPGGALASKVVGAIDILGLTNEELGGIVNASARSVARWATGAVVPQKLNKDRLLELAYVAEALAEVLPRDHANVWMFSPNRMLDHHRPADLVRDGEYKLVLDAIEAMADGVFM
jgi:uncharacterized protein (DUF2384 family)